MRRLIMTAPVCNMLLAVHVSVSVGWVGALTVFLAHAIASLVSEDEQIIRAMSLAMELTAWFVILPLSLASLTTGIVQAVGTAWRLIRHYWVLFKLLLTGVATLVLLMKLGPIEDLADAARSFSFPEMNLIQLRMSLAVHAAGGLVVLLAALVLAIFKPVGQTRGRMPRWVKIFGSVLGMLMLAIGWMLLAGRHGPGANMS